MFFLNITASFFRDFKLDILFEDEFVRIFHTSFFTNFSSYLVGVLFGAIYYQYRNSKITVTKVMITSTRRFLLFKLKTCGKPIFHKIP